VFYKSVVTKVNTHDNVISSITIRTRESELNGIKFSEQVENWYDPAYAQVETILTHPNNPVVIETGDFGDILVLSRANYIQGQEKTAESQNITQESCGQAISYPFALTMTEFPTRMRIPQHFEKQHNFDIRNKYFNWEQIWSYRKVRNQVPTISNTPNTGEISLQNWEVGNDYKEDYFLLSKSLANSQAAAQWKGGLNTQTLENAENQSYSWLSWLLKNTPVKFANRVHMDTEILGTAHGLSKIPYIRDTRRAIGINNFLLSYPMIQRQNNNRGTVFADRVAIGGYPIDIHELSGCKYTPPNTKIYPYYIPYRALTSNSYSNLLVAGKNMAQDFEVASSTRVHVTEYATGSASGVIASVLQSNNWTTQDGLTNIKQLQTKIKTHTPIEWNF
jgi:FAD dependent oxidoreductase